MAPLGYHVVTKGHRQASEVLVLLEEAKPEKRNEILKSNLDEHGNTALHYAALHGLSELIERVFDLLHNLQPLDLLKTQNYDGQTVLHQAVIGNSSEIVKFLLVNLDDSELMELTQITDHKNNTAEDWAVSNNNIEITMMLEEHRQIRPQQKIEDPILDRRDTSSLKRVLAFLENYYQEQGQELTKRQKMIDDMQRSIEEKTQQIKESNSRVAENQKTIAELTADIAKFPSKEITVF